jgi:antitoxin HicB
MAEAIIRIHIEPLEEGGYLATSGDVPALVAQGRTIAETLEIAEDVCKKLYESYIENGETVPEPLSRVCQGDFDTLIAVAV